MTGQAAKPIEPSASRQVAELSFAREADEVDREERPGQAPQLAEQRQYVGVLMRNATRTRIQFHTT